MSAAAAPADAAHVARARRPPPWASKGLAVLVALLAIMLPLFFDPISGFIDDARRRAGLRRDGARPEHRRRLRRPARPRATSRSSRSARTRSAGSGSGFLRRTPNIHILVVGSARNAAGHPPQLPARPRHRRVPVARWRASLIGLPTLRLRGDYIAIVTLAFGEIIGCFAVNGDDHHRSATATTLTGRPPGDHAGRPGRAAVPRPVHPAEPETVVLVRARRWCSSCCS